jgi:hypothetical protein
MLRLGSKKERFIRKVLKSISKQRVALILQPGNVFVIEKAPASEPGIEEALRTCHIRGWVEPICNAIPKGKLTKNGRLPDGDLFTEIGPYYRLTEAGWSIIRRTHLWVVTTCLIALATLIGTICGLWIMLSKS